MANDDFERQARNTTSSLEDLESKYNVSIERGVLIEEEIKNGEQEREALRIENQRLRDELGDLKIEAEIRQDKLRNAEAAADNARMKKPAPLSHVVVPSQSSSLEDSPTTTTSSPTIATPPAQSTSSTISETPTPPSPPTSETSAPPQPITPALPLPKSRLSISNSNTTPRPLNSMSRPPRHSRGPSIPVINDRSLSSVARRTTINRQDQFAPASGLPHSGSLHQIRGLIGKMQKLEQRVNSARSKLPGPTSTPPRASPRSGSAMGHTNIPATVTVRSNRKRTGGSNASSAFGGVNGGQRPQSRLSFGISQTSPSRDSQEDNRPLSRDQRPSSRLSFGIPQPSPNRETHFSSRPSSRASLSTRTSISHLPGATVSNCSRPSSRQSVSGARTPLGHYAPSTQSEVRRPRSSMGGAYQGHSYSASVSRLSNYGSQTFEDAEEENGEVLTPTPSRRTTVGKGDQGTGIPVPGVARKMNSISNGRRTSSGPGDMGPPQRKGVQKMSDLGETF